MENLTAQITGYVAAGNVNAVLALFTDVIRDRDLYERRWCDAEDRLKEVFASTDRFFEEYRAAGRGR